jgi:N utilization substance protein A
VGERIRAVVMEVRKAGSRVKIVLSRAHSDLVRRLFEIEIPEIAERVIEVRSISREAGYRSKVAVSCIDSKIDAVGACVGVRGSRIKNIIDELAGERIDIVRWNDSLQVLVPNAMQPAKVDDVILCPMLGKVIVLVQEDQLSLAIGKKGQNVRLASKLVGWDISVLTQERLDEQLDRSIEAFSSIPGVTSELAESLVSQGFFTFEDLSVIEPDQLAELGSLSPEACDEIIAHADIEAERIEREEKRLSAERARLAAEERALGLPQDYGSMGTRSVTGEIVLPGGAGTAAATAVAVAETVTEEAAAEATASEDSPEAGAADVPGETQAEPAAAAAEEVEEASAGTAEPQ